MDKNNPYLQTDLLFPYIPEIGNALAGVLSATQALRYGAARDVDFRRDLLNDMEDNLQYLRVLYENWIVSEALRAGNLEIARRPVDMSSWLGPFLSPWGKRALDREIGWEFEEAADLPRAWFDRVRVELALENLLWGALAAVLRDGAVRVLAGTSGKLPWFEVSDSGAPLTQVSLAAALEGRGSRQREEARFADGRLLGIRVADALARLHGGALEVVERDGFTTTMRLSLDPAGSPS